jgi:hypothetical protein
VGEEMDGDGNPRNFSHFQNSRHVSLSMKLLAVPIIFDSGFPPRLFKTLEKWSKSLEQVDGMEWETKRTESRFTFYLGFEFGFWILCGKFAELGGRVFGASSENSTARCEN